MSRVARIEMRPTSIYMGLSKASSPSSLGRQGLRGCHCGRASDEAARVVAAERRPAVGLAVIQDLVDESDCLAWLVPKRALHTASSTDLAQPVDQEKVAHSVSAEGNEVVAELLETPDCFCIDLQTHRVEAEAADVSEGEGRRRSVSSRHLSIGGASGPRKRAPKFPTCGGGGNGKADFRSTGLFASVAASV
ncbi:hypothetical protein KC356_g312 [Hortaea werneckii]|nr:hypothetical protein KC356_g312 [Hortaea werneckii]